MQRADGEEFPAEVFASDIVYRGRPATQVVVIDVTERVRMQQAIRDSEARFRSLFAAMTDVILILDAEGRYLEVVPTKPDLLYRPAEELLGRTLREIFAEEQADFFLTHITEALRTGRPVQMEYTLDIGGKALRFAATASPLSPTTVFFVARDVTALVEQREQLLTAERAPRGPGRASQR